jgi:hypothetical protein
MEAVSARASVEVRHLRSYVITEAFESVNVAWSEENSEAQIVWWDGLPVPEEFAQHKVSQKVNKIPFMDILCYKSTLFQALNQMQTLYPGLYKFFPKTLMLPHQFSEFHKEHVRLSGKFEGLTWILKPHSGCCGSGIRLVMNPFDIVNESSPAVIQQYVTPYLINGYKFDFRFYILIADLLPLTVFVYSEGIARFCTQFYSKPTKSNLRRRFAHLTNTAVNVENIAGRGLDFTRKATDVIAEINSGDLWQKIKNVCALTIQALYPQMVSNCNNVSSRKSAKVGAPIDPLHRHFHILGIDIIIDQMGEPMVLELNDRPSMKVTFPFEHGLKKGLIRDALEIVMSDCFNRSEGNKWERVLPMDESDPLQKAMRAIQQRTFNVFGPKLQSNILTGSSRSIVYPKPTPDKMKILFKHSRYPTQ